MEHGSLRVEFEPLHWLFVNLAGVLGVLWALVRLRTPTPELALLDVAGRFAVAALILHATAAGGMTPLLHFFVASELGGAVAQYWAVRRAAARSRRSQRRPSRSASELQVRAFEERDLEALVALLLEAFPDPAPHNEPRASIRRKLGVDRELLLVGIAGGRLVATAMGGWDGHRGWLYQVAVAPDARGHGHGRAIVAAAEARLRARGCAKLNLQVLGVERDRAGLLAQARLSASRSASASASCWLRASARADAQTSSSASSSSRVWRRRIKRAAPASTSTSGA